MGDGKDYIALIEVQAKTNENIAHLETRKAARETNSRGSPNRLIGISFSHLALASAALIPSLSAAACANSLTCLARVTGQYIKVLYGHENIKERIDGHSPRQDPNLFDFLVVCNIFYLITAL